MEKFTETIFYGQYSGKNQVFGHKYAWSNTSYYPNGTVNRVKPNKYTYRYWKLRNVNQSPGPYTVFLPPTGNVFAHDLSAYGSAVASLNNEVYAKWMGKLRKGNASLGVTLGSWGQTSRMITDRQNKLASKLDTVIALLRNNRSARKRIIRDKEPVAGIVLEGTFGWAPLIEDVRNLLMIAAGGNEPPERISAHGTRSFNHRVTRQDDANGQYWTDNEVVVKLKYTANVQMTNPNLFLLNKMGLINLPSVAWDLVPWSFVVNMFSNMGSLVGSMSDTVGVDISDESMMLKSYNLTTSFARDAYFNSTTNSQGFSVTKDRTLNARPSLSLELRLPELSWSLAAIASSLVIQKVKRINNILGI